MNLAGEGWWEKAAPYLGGGGYLTTRTHMVPSRQMEEEHAGGNESMKRVMGDGNVGGDRQLAGAVQLTRSGRHCKAKKIRLQPLDRVFFLALATGCDRVTLIASQRRKGIAAHADGRSISFPQEVYMTKADQFHPITDPGESPPPVSASPPPANMRFGDASHGNAMPFL